MLISREYELVNRFIILKCTCFEDIQRNYPKLQNAEDTIMAIQKFSWLTFRLNWCIEYTYWTKHFQYSYPWCQWPQSNADLLMHVVDAYALMPNFDVAWARRSFSFGKCQVYFSLPANVHPDSYLVSIHSWLNKVDPTRSHCVLHVTSKVVLSWEGKCFFDSDWSYQGQNTRYFVLKYTKVCGVPHAMREQQFVWRTSCYPRRTPRSALLKMMFTLKTLSLTLL